MDHHKATTWGITWSGLPAGQAITGATLKFSQLYDWQVEPNSLYIHLLNNPAYGVNSWTDNSNDNVMSDYFSGQGVWLATYSDSDGPATKVNWSYAFSAGELLTLTSYLNDPNSWWQGDFGFGFDPDCHYFNSGVTFELTTGPSNIPGVPDSGSALALFGCSAAAMWILRRRSTQRLR